MLKICSLAAVALLGASTLAVAQGPDRGGPRGGGRGFSPGPAGSSRRAACTAGGPAKVFATAARQRTAATYG